ncbi:hypothetical protein ACP8HI_03825 [Paenibacillus sp. FA6]|uniref:hypothetical protein n=1 Tax=Paenibacillus sp. FA6 TaxID=3413029 RepID=UPI003F65A992
MKCKSCGASVTRNFCAKCGTRTGITSFDDVTTIPEEELSAVDECDQIAVLETENGTDTDTESIMEVKNEATNEVTNEATNETANETKHTYGKQSVSKRIVISLSAAATGTVALVVAISILFGWLVRKGTFFTDFIYHLLKQVVSLSPEQAAYFSERMSHDFWLQMVLMHGGYIRGEYLGASVGAEEGLFSFNINIPLLVSLLFTASLIYLVMFLLRPIFRKYTGRAISRLLWLIYFSGVYSILISLLLLIFRTKSTYFMGESEYSLTVSASVVPILITSFILALLAGGAGLGGWKWNARPEWMTLAGSLRTFTLTVMGFHVLIGGLMIGSWSLSTPNKLSSTEVLTMGNVWKVYQNDPAVYAILPNVLLQEQIYALGGAWEVSGPLTAAMLDIREPLKMSMLTGSQSLQETAITKDDNGVSEWLSTLESDIRVKWYHGAFLITYLYALSRIRLKNWWTWGVAVISVVLSTTLLAIFLNVEYKLTSYSRGIIGFSFLQVLLALTITTVFLLALSFGFQRLILRRKEVAK